MQKKLQYVTLSVSSEALGSIVAALSGSLADG